MKNQHVGPRKATRSLLEGPTRKTKKSKSTELTVQTSGSLDKAAKRQIKSYFGKDAPKIMDMIEAGDADGGLTLLKKKLLLTSVRLLPKAEKILNESEGSKGTYQFVTMVSQIRELITDIQADQDRQYIAQRLLENVLRPAFMDIAQMMITEHYSFNKDCKDYLRPRHQKEFSTGLRNLAKSIAQEMTVKYKEIEARTIEVMKS